MRNPLAAAMKPGGDRGLANPQRSAGLAVRESHHIDRHDCVAEVGRESGDHREQLTRPDPGFWLRRVRVLEQVEEI